MKTLFVFAFCLTVTFAAVELPPQTKCAAGDPPCDGVDNPCLNGGKCCMQQNKPVCDCSASTAYGGGFCHLCIKESCGFVDPCGKNACQNGGVCTTLPLVKPFYRCACPKNADGVQLYYGSVCQAKHVCIHNTSVCLNGGTCTANVAACSCPKNADGVQPYRGRFCETKHICFHNTSVCLNGGICSTLVCTCPKNADGVLLFLGAFCQTPNPCNKNPCFGNTKCILIGAGSYYCNCGNNDRWGKNCEEISACGNNTHECQNGGKCVVRPYSDSIHKRYICQCVDDYTCNRCQFKKACPMNPETGEKVCARGYCYQPCKKANDAYCRYCPAGWTGPYCTEQLGVDCTARNDPHMVNFDGMPFEYHGTCDHIMTKTCVAASRWPTHVPVFQVTATHKTCRSDFAPGIACVHKIGIEIDGDHIELILAERKIDVVVNGQAPDVLPYLKKSKNSDMNLVEIQVDQHSPLSQLNIETAWGLTVAASGGSVATILDMKLSRTLAGLVCGVCGPLKFDNKGFAGGSTPNKKFVETTLKFPLHPPGCDPYDDGLQLVDHDRKKRAVANPVYVLKNASVVCKTPEQLEKARTLCSIINDPEGPFAPDCLEKNIYRAQLYEACILDICVNETFYCSNMEMYAEVCGKLGPIKDWREATECGHFCLKNQEYKQGIIKRCSPSCKNKVPCPTDDPTVKVKKVFEEGCVCKEGLIWDSVSASCVTEDQCGKTEPAFPEGFGQDEMCEFRGLKFMLGEARWDRCRKLCTCGEGGNWTCSNYRGYHCGPRECRDLNACLHRNVDFPKQCDETFVNHRLVFSEEYAEKFAHRVKRHAILDEAAGSSPDILREVISRDDFNSRASKHGGGKNEHEHEGTETESDDADVEDDDSEESDSSESKSVSETKGRVGPKDKGGAKRGGGKGKGKGHRGNKSGKGRTKNMDHSSIEDKTEDSSEPIDEEEDLGDNSNTSGTPETTATSTASSAVDFKINNRPAGRNLHGSEGKEDREKGHREDLRFLMKHVIIVVDSEHVKKCQRN